MGRLAARSTAIGAALFLSLFVASVAWTWWQASGAGTGAASSGTVQQVTLTPAVPTSELYPGGQAAVEVSVSNPNAVPLRIESLRLDTTQAASGFAVDTAHADCGASSLSFSTQTNGGGGWTIGANASTTISLHDSLAMGTDAANACQGAAITVYLTAGVS